MLQFKPRSLAHEAGALLPFKKQDFSESRDEMGDAALSTFVTLSVDCIFHLLLHPRHPRKKNWAERKETLVVTALKVQASLLR